MDDLNLDLGDFKSQLSELTFEELIELKQKVGAKVYNEGIKPKDTKASTIQFTRINKNRPREVSSKIPPPRFVVPALKAPIKQEKTEIVSRDPRFDAACGDYNEKNLETISANLDNTVLKSLLSFKRKHYPFGVGITTYQIFKSNYSFLNKVRRKEKKILQKELIETSDPERKSQIKSLLQRMDNKEREEKKNKLKELKEKEEKELRKQAVKDGKKPFYSKKSEKRLLELVDNYEQLKKSGKLNKHLERRMKKNNHKERKKFLQAN